MTDTIESLREQKENAVQAMADAAPNWEARCHAIMAALNVDFGGYDENVPEVGSYYQVKLARLEAEVAALREQMSLIAVMGHSSDPAVASNIARIAVERARAALSPATPPHTTGD